MFFFAFMIAFSSCRIHMKIDAQKDNEKVISTIEIIVENIKETTYKGWWIYGEGQHIFKDEKTLDEYDLEFPNEIPKEIQTLYLAVCQMEYFPMECTITGYTKTNLLSNQKTLVVSSFEILYVEGCGE